MEYAKFILNNHYDEYVRICMTEFIAEKEIETAREEGIRSALQSIYTARRLMKSHFSDKDITEITGLTQDIIDELKK